MALIDFDAAKAALVDFRDELKRLKCYRSAGTVERCITKLLDVESVEAEAAQTAQRVSRIEKWFPDRDCVTGREVWCCGNCGIRIEKRDRYCKGCGRRFVDTSSVT